MTPHSSVKSPFAQPGYGTGNVGTLGDPRARGCPRLIEDGPFKLEAPPLDRAD